MQSYMHGKFSRSIQVKTVINHRRTEEAIMELSTKYQDSSLEYV